MTGSGRTKAYLGLGSNLGERESHLQQAISRLDAHPDIRVIRVSPVYETAAHTLRDERQPSYLNAVAEIETSLSAADLLHVCHDVERLAGRDRKGEERWASRTLDIDVLVFGSKTLEEEGITIPHPRIGGRQFVLRPLADLAPDLRLPEPYSATVRDLLESCTDDTVVEKTALTITP